MALTFSGFLDWRNNTEGTGIQSNEYDWDRIQQGIPATGFPSPVYCGILPNELTEKNGSRSESYTDTEFTASVEYYCPWDLRNDCADWLMRTVYNAPVTDVTLDGDTVDHFLWDSDTDEESSDYNYGLTEVTVSGDGYFMQVGSDSSDSTVGTYWTFGDSISPYRPNLQANYYNKYYPAIATSVKVSTVGPEGTYVNTDITPSFQKYTKAVLSVEYKGIARPSKMTVDETVTPNFGMRQLPSWGFYWRSDGSPVLDNEAPGIQEVQASINRNIKGLRRIPWWFYRLAGKVNSNAWSDLLTDVTYLPGTLMFVPSNMQRTMTSDRGDDDNLWDISFEIKWNPIGWNNFQRPHAIDSMMRKGNQAILYPYAYFPSMILDPNNKKVTDPNEVGVPYSVVLEDEHGYFYVICVDSFGSVGAFAWL